MTCIDSSRDSNPMKQDWVKVIFGPDKAEKAVEELLDDLALDADSYNNDALMQLTAACQEEIRRNEDDDDPKWPKLLPKLLGLLYKRNSVTLPVTGEEMSGPEFRNYFINQLVNSGAATELLCPVLRDLALTAAFTQDEMGLIMGSMCGLLGKKKPADLPAFVYQLLQLTRESSSVILLKALMNLFRNGQTSGTIEQCFYLRREALQWTPLKKTGFSKPKLLLITESSL